MSIVERIAVVMITVALSAGGACSPGEPPVQQAPITFVVKNLTADTLYFDWSTMGNNRVLGEFLADGSWESVLFWSSYCTDTCESCERGGCVMRCSILPRAKQFPPGQEMRFIWDASGLYVFDTWNGTQSCMRMEALKAGSYRATVGVSASYTCQSASCEPDADGIITNAVVSEDVHVSAEFAIPTAVAEIVMEFR